MDDEPLFQSMTLRSRQVLDGRLPAWEVVGAASGDANELVDRTPYAVAAYAMWAEISDLCDGINPGDEERGNRVACEVAAAWLALDVSAGEEVNRFFTEWEPYFGRRFRGAAGWREWSRWSRPFWRLWDRVRRRGR